MAQKNLFLSTVVVAAGLLALPGCEHEDTTGEPGSQVDSEIDDLVDRFMSRRGVVGLGLGVVANGEVAYLRGYGEADRDGDVPVDPYTTLFRWASVSKTLTAAAALSLIDSGHLDLDTHVAHVYTSYQQPGIGIIGNDLGDELSTPITVRHLLSHRSGIQHYGNGATGIHPEPPANQRDDPDVNTGFEWALARWIEEPLISIPGGAFHYSSPAYNLLGVVIGAAQKQIDDSYLTLEDAYLARVEGLLAGTPALGLRPDYQWVSIPNRAKGYWVDEDLTVTSQGNSDVSWKLPSGGFLSTTSQAAHYCRLLMTDTLLSATSRALIWGGIAFPPLPLGIGENNAPDFSSHNRFGFMVELVDDRKRVYHNGKQQKVRSRLSFYPDEGIGVVVFSNTASSFSDEDEEGDEEAENAIDELGSFNVEVLDAVETQFETPRIRVQDLTDAIEELVLERLEAGEAPIQL